MGLVFCHEIMCASLRTYINEFLGPKILKFVKTKLLIKQEIFNNVSIKN